MAQSGPPEGHGEPEGMSPRALYWASQATMCVSILVFFYESFAYNAIFLKRILPAVGKASLVPVFRVLFDSVWVLGLWSYHQAHWSDPGAIPARWRQFVVDCGEALPIAPARPEWQPAKATLCKKCQAARPERAHHCVLCGVCVMRMDHHCPWINNCVGVHNHKFFLLLGIYAWLASLIGLGTSLPELWRLAGVAVGVQGNLASKGGLVQDLEMWDIYAFLLFGLFAFLIALLLTSLLSTHVPLALRNLTTIEDFYENMPNPYEQGGSRISNLAQVFGKFGIDWFLPVRPCRPLSDGISYPRVSGQNFFEQRDFEALTLVDGGVMTEDQAYGGAVGMMHDPAADVERTWRVRYKVRTPEELKALKEDKSTPWQFWACGQQTSQRSVGRVMFSNGA
mmetsp:Transcript_50190/g.162511  ORF Transcript_50190/g.162511 Transcript_50190/m.162511 type:complete len:395 (+) Transcript_50190:73-1257(+)